MDGSAELARLAELLRIGAGVARKIVDVRPTDAAEIRGLADEAERMAAQLETMVKRASIGDVGRDPPSRDRASRDTLQ